MPEEYIVTCDHLEETGVATGRKAMQQLLQLDPRPDAVFCYNDPAAIGAIEATIEAGLAFPSDIAFIGCGNMRYNDYLRVPLSSIDHGTAELGRIAGELALDLANKPEQPPRSILVPPTLVARASSSAEPVALALAWSRDAIHRRNP